LNFRMSFDFDRALVHASRDASLKRKASFARIFEGSSGRILGA